MHVTLVGIASKYIHQNLAPWCLKAGLAQYGVKSPCRVLEMNINQPFSQALEALMETKPQIAGFSCYIWNIRMVRSLASCLKLLSPKTVIVLGGPEAGSRPESVMQEIPQADYVISGPGEYAFAQLCKRLASREDAGDIPGLTFRQSSGLLTNPPAPLVLPPPSPYTKECIKHLNGRIAYVETSRGCPFHCAFCMSGREDGVIFLPMAQAKKDLLKAAASGAKTIKLVDRTFNCHRERAMELIRFLIKKHRDGAFTGVCFHFEVAADLFDEKTLALLNSAPPGLFQLEAGLQSFHEKTLEACQRKTDLQKLTRNVSALVQANNIHMHIDLIAGLPYENFKTFGESFNRAYQLKAHMLQLGFLKLLPGSRLWEQREEYGLLHNPEPPYEILENRWLSHQDIGRLKRCEQAVDRILNSGRFRSALDLVLDSCGLAPFELFCGLGDLMAKKPGGLSLEQLTELAMNFFLNLPNIRKDALRDALALDHIASDNTGRLPACLEIIDPRLKQAVASLRREYPPGTKLGAIITYARGEYLHWTDYARRNPVTGVYDLKFKPLSFFL